MTNLRDKVDIKLSGDVASELARRPITYDAGFTLLPGTYTLKFLARDADTGRIGTYIRTFVIPNLEKEKQRVPISSVVLSSQKVELQEALYTAGKDKDKLRVQNLSPLVEEGEKLVPSVTRVFSRSRDMYVFFQAYQPGVEPQRPVVAFVTLYSGGQKAFETAPLAVAEGAANRLRTVPLRFRFPLDSLPEGEYRCQVTVLDPNGGKVTFWQAPVMLIP